MCCSLNGAGSLAENMQIATPFERLFEQYDEIAKASAVDHQHALDDLACMLQFLGVNEQFGGSDS